MVIDLHLTKEIIESSHFDPKHALSIQLSILEKEIDKALVANVSEITIIHGIGSGILKKEVHKVLKKHSHIDKYANEYNILYGMGSTKATIKK